MSNQKQSCKAGKLPVLSCHCSYECLGSPEGAERGNDDPYEVHNHKVKPEVEGLRPGVDPSCRMILLEHA